MSRSPLVAWRKLFAIGGAPAASHLVLARAPSAEKLLNALAGARVINADRLEALTKPLDLGGALSRASARTPDERRAEIPEARVPRTRAERAAEIVQDVRSSHAPLSESPLTDRSRHARTSSDAITARTSNVLSENAVQPTRRRPFVGAPSAVRSKPVARFAHEVPKRDSSTPLLLAEFSNIAASKTAFPPAAQSGANARVIVTSAVPEIYRLLAGTPPAVAANGTAGAANSPSASVPAAVSRTQDVSNLLVDAVDRARAAMSAGTDRPAHQVQASARDLRHDVTPAPSGSESGGGFRGLAHRTLGNTRVARRAPTQRIEPETRVSNDLAMDALDSRVADSLARVLEREARRHGIDLAEARS